MVMNDVVKPELPVTSVGERASEAETEGWLDAHWGSHEGAIAVVDDVVEPALPVTSVEEGAGKAETGGGLDATR